MCIIEKWNFYLSKGVWIVEWKNSNIVKKTASNDIRKRINEQIALDENKRVEYG